MADTRFFTNKGPFTLEVLSKISGTTLDDEAHKDRVIYDVAPLGSAGEYDMSFLSNKKYRESLITSKAGACIIDAEELSYAPKNMALLISTNPYYSYAKIAAYFYDEESNSETIAKTAKIAASAKIGNNVTLGEYVVIGENAIIGDGSLIEAGTVIGKGVVIGKECHFGSHVTVTHALIGNGVRLHCGVRIGQDGFGFATDQGHHLPVPQLGRVIIEDNVDIGANSTIDRGTGPDTIIGKNSRIDNLVQIGHNVQTGIGCVIVAQVGISGSTKLGDYVMIGGQGGIAGHLTIGSGAKISAQAGVMRSVKDGEMQGGSPSVPIRQWHKQNIALKNLARNYEES